MTIKVDHKGNLVDIGIATTVDNWGVVHKIFAPNHSLSQLLTVCGRRGQGFLGNDEVTCKECLNAARSS